MRELTLTKSLLSSSMLRSDPPHTKSQPSVWKAASDLDSLGATILSVSTCRGQVALAKLIPSARRAAAAAADMRLL